MEKTASMVQRIWRPTLNERFKDHPKHAEIMRAYDSGDVSTEQWDLWFMEVEILGWKRLSNISLPAADENGNVHFEMYKGEPRVDRDMTRLHTEALDEDHAREVVQYDECVDKDGGVWPEHNFGDNGCCRCAAKLEGSEDQ